MSAEWEAAPERPELILAVELLSSQPRDAPVKLERLAKTSSEVIRKMAMYNIAVGYAAGVFGQRDYVNAEEWYRLSASNGYRRAEFELGRMLRKMGQYQRALDVFKGSAAIGYAPSMRLVGSMYARGEGVVRDLDQARRWWERSVARGNVIAKGALGYEMARGEYGWTRRPLGVFLFLAAQAELFYVALTSSLNDARLT